MLSRNEDQLIFLTISGDNLKIMGMGQKLFERSLAHERVMKTRLKINKSEKMVFFSTMRKVASDIQKLN